MVIIHHIEQTKSQFLLPNLWHNNTILYMGKTGVILFFVLSGFLITYLLLNENELTKKINIKSFYIKRILRIWPLYYIITISVFFILPYLLPSIFIHTFFYQKLTLYTFISANISLAVYGATIGANHLWSVATEEHFYLIWPWLNKYVKNKIKLFLIVIFSFLLIKISCSILFEESNPLRTYLHHFCIDCMAIGGIIAYLYHTEHKFLNLIYNKYIFYMAVIIAILFIGIGIYIPFIQYEFFAIIIAIIIINLATNKDYKHFLENKFFSYMGQISYGLYMYHPIVIIICIYLLKKLNYTNSIFIYTCCITCTITLSMLSYHLIETKFLKLKPKLS